MALKVKYLNPFIEGASSILEDTCRTEVQMGKPYIKNAPFSNDNVAILIGITGDVKGQVIFNMSTKNAKAVASKMMMGMEVTELNEMSKSAISELTNMILGTTATLFYNEGVTIDITPPSMLMGEGLEITTNKIENIAIPLEFKEDDIKFEINISLQENER